MTYTELMAKQTVALTVLQCGVESALFVDIATPEQKLAWIAKDLKDFKEKMEKMEAEFRANDEVGDPFANTEA